VHHALIAAFAIPPDDMFQVLSVADASLVRYDPSYLGVSRDDDVVIVQIILGRGRTDAQKRAFYAELARRATDVHLEPRNLVVTLVENDLADWSFGNGVAQHLDRPPAWRQPDGS
jgi:hypothetical protein